MKIGVFSHTSVRAIILLALLSHPTTSAPFLTDDVPGLLRILFGLDLLLSSSQFLGLLLFLARVGFLPQLSRGVGFGFVLELLKFHFFVFALSFGIFFMIHSVIFSRNKAGFGLRVDAAFGGDVTIVLAHAHLERGVQILLSRVESIRP